MARTPSPVLVIALATLGCRVEPDSVDLSSLEADIAALKAAQTALEEEMLAVTGVDVSDLENDVQSNEDDIADLEDRANALETSTFATQIWVEARDYASASNLDLLTTTVSSNTTTLSSHATTLLSQANTLASHTTDIASNTAAAATNAADVATNTAGIATVSTTAGTNATDIAANTASLTTISGTASTNATDIATNTATLATNSTALTNLELAATVHYNTFGSSDGRDSGTITDRTLTFTKQSDDSVILVTWYDNFSTDGNAKACHWEIYLNGQQCSSPARINGDFYVHETGGGNQQLHRFGVITGLCDTAGSDPLNTGSIAITAQVGNSPGYSGSDCHTGWNNQQSILMAQELVF